VRQRADLIAQLELLEPRQGNRADAERGTEDVPGNRARAVAVATVIHGNPKPPRQVLAGSERRVHGDRECFLSDPPLADVLHGLGRWRHRLARVDRPVQRHRALIGLRLPLEAVDRCVHRIGDRFAMDQAIDDQRERTGRVESARVSVSQRGDIGPELERIGIIDESRRGSAHDATASLAIVDPMVDRPRNPLTQRGEAGVARRTAAAQLLDTNQPAIEMRDRRRERRHLSLCMQPADVRVVHRANRRPASPALRLAARPQQALGGEQRHLGVVGDRTDPSERFVEVDDSARAVTLADLGERQKLDRSTERVSDRAGQQASLHTRAMRDPAWARCHRPPYSKDGPNDVADGDSGESAPASGHDELRSAAAVMPR
jgi:hypothetical protein